MAPIARVAIVGGEPLTYTREQVDAMLAALTDEFIAKNARLAEPPSAELSEYLKDGETAAECIARNRRDVVTCLGMLAAERTKAGRLEEALRLYARHEHWMSIGEDGPRVILVAHGRADGNDGWAEAESALRASETKEESR